MFSIETSRIQPLNSNYQINKIIKKEIKRINSIADVLAKNEVGKV